MSRIGIIPGGSRPNRNGEQVAHWVLEVASRRHDADFELVDLRDYPLPHLDEPLPLRRAQERHRLPVRRVEQQAVGFVSYGGAGGARAVEHLRLVAGELRMADVRQQVALSLITEFENFSVFKPGDYNLPALNAMLDQVVAWSTALTPLRGTAAAAA